MKNNNRDYSVKMRRWAKNNNKRSSLRKMNSYLKFLNNHHNSEQLNLLTTTTQYEKTSNADTPANGERRIGFDKIR